MTIQNLNIPEAEQVRYGAGKMQNTKKRKELMAKFNSARENFEKKEKEMRADLREASRIWRKVGEKFRWWQSLP